MTDAARGGAKVRAAFSFGDATVAFDDPPQPGLAGLAPMPTAAHAALVLAVYGEELAQGARVAVFGDATSGLAQELLTRGARLVHVYDSDGARVVEANARAHDRAIYFARLPEGGDAGVRDGAFDLVILPDLSAVDDPAAVLAVSRRVLSAQGAAIIASPNPDATPPVAGARSRGAVLGYYELYEAVVAHFPSVRMLGQVPFVGYAVAEFAAVDPEPTIDSSLAEGREPEWFIALASQRGVRLEPFALVELPAHPAANAAPTVPSKPGLRVVPEPPAAVSGTVLVNILEAEREAALDALRQQEQLVAEERGRAIQAGSALSAAREEIGLQRERIAMLERELEQRASTHQESAEELAARRDEANRLRAELATKRTEQQSIADELAARQTLIGRLTAELAAIEPLRARVRELEASLRDGEAHHQDETRRVAGEHEQRARHANDEVQQRILSATREQEAIAKKVIAEHEERAKKAVAEHEERTRKAVAEHEERTRKAIAIEHEARARKAASEHEERLRQATADYEHDVARLEAQLREVGRDASELRAEVARRERLVRELIATYVSAGEAPSLPIIVAAESNGSGNGSGEIARLAREAATREADLVATRWKIAQLERELGHRR